MLETNATGPGFPTQHDSKKPAEGGRKFLIPPKGRPRKLSQGQKTEGKGLSNRTSSAYIQRSELKPEG